MKRLLFGLVVVVAVAAATCTDAPTSPTTSWPDAATPTAGRPAEGRTLGIAITEGELSFDDAFRVVSDAGFSHTELPLFWDELETAPFRFEPEVDIPAILDAFYPAQGWGVSLTLSVVDTVADRRPGDLQDLAFDDPAVIDRLAAYVDWLAGQMPTLEIDSISIGNEVDIYLGMTGRWGEYGRFLDQAVPIVRTAFPGIPVGVVQTFEGLTGPDSGRAVDLIGRVDIATVTYYPLDSAYQVRDPAGVGDDIDALLEVIGPGKSLHLNEVGYPTGAINGSSEEAQAGFVRAIFGAWDDHADRIPVVVFVWLHDVGHEAVAAFDEYYGVSDEGFSSYLATLGLRTADGTDKAGFTALVGEAAARGL